MKTRSVVAMRRGVIQKLWELSNEIDTVAQHVRYASKPSDLSLPIENLAQLTRRLQVFKDQWLMQWLKSRGEALSRWPKLWERYL